jgi:hypothetical protein
MDERGGREEKHRHQGKIDEGGMKNALTVCLFWELKRLRGLLTELTVRFGF